MDFPETSKTAKWINIPVGDIKDKHEEKRPKHKQKWSLENTPGEDVED